MKKLYLGCALANAPKEFVEQVLRFRSKLETVFNVLKFIDLQEPRPTDPEIFQWDMRQVAACDAMLAIGDEPSFGLGFEVARALLLTIPVLVVAKEGRKISPFLPGIDGHGATFMRYRDFDHLFEIVTEHFLP